MSLFLVILLAITQITKAHVIKQQYGPFFYPTGADTDPIFITCAFDSTHFYVNMSITGEYWFGFGFASGSDCTAYSTICPMLNTESIIFGYYASSSVPLTAKIFKLENHESGSEMSSQYLTLSVLAHYSSEISSYKYNVDIIRPYNPYLYGGDTASYIIPYPKTQSSFCWLWAQGNNMLFNSETIQSQITSHMNKGHQCIQLNNVADPEKVIDNITTDTTHNEHESHDHNSTSIWLKDNLIWIIIILSTVIVICFFCALCCFWYSQNNRTAQRRKKRQNMLDAETFKLEHGLNIDIDARNRMEKKRKREQHSDCSDSESNESVIGKQKTNTNRENDTKQSTIKYSKNGEKNETETITLKEVMTNNDTSKKRRKRKPKPKRKRKPSKQSTDSNDSNDANAWYDDSDNSQY